MFTKDSPPFNVSRLKTLLESIINSYSFILVHLICLFRKHLNPSQIKLIGQINYSVFEKLPS